MRQVRAEARAAYGVVIAAGGALLGGWHEGPGFSRGSFADYCCRVIAAALAAGRTAFFARPRSINSDSLT